MKSICSAICCGSFEWCPDRKVRHELSDADLLRGILGGAGKVRSRRVTAGCSWCSTIITCSRWPAYGFYREGT